MAKLGRAGSMGKGVLKTIPSAQKAGAPATVTVGKHGKFSNNKNNKFNNNNSSFAAAKKGSSQHYDGNPINAKATDADWDEDIDEDFAFNSEDEKMFGHHFKAPSADAGKKMRKTTADVKKGSGKQQKAFNSDDDDFSDDDNDTADMTGIFDRLNPSMANKSAAATTGAKGKKPELKNDDEIGSDHFSDDSRSEIDLEEMLMTKDEQRKAREKRKKKKAGSDAAGVATKTSKTLGGRAGATETDDFLLRQQEGLLIGGDLQDNLNRLSAISKKAGGDLSAAAAKKALEKGQKTKKEHDELYDLSTAVINPDAEKRTLSKSEMASIKALVEESEGLDKGQTATRLLSAVNNRKALLTEDIDEYEKTKQDRAQAREIVGKSLKRYDGVLKEQKLTKHLSFPLEVPDADAVPHTLGGMAAAIMEKNDQIAAYSSSTTAPKAPALVTPAAAAANSLAAKMQALLESSGLATKKKAANDGSGAFQEGQEGYVDLKDRPEGYEENEGDENEFAMRQGGGSSGEGGGVDRNYMAMLKAKLGYEIARRTRFNKIKSKTYRRILRKEEEREKSRREQAAEILDPEGARRRRMEKMEKDRALERVTQKHKNTSKWVRHVKGIAKYDDNAKDAIQQQLMTHNRLMQKMDEDAGAEWEDYDEAEKASEAESDEQDRIVDELLNGDEEQTAKKGSSLFWAKSDGASNAEKKEGEKMSFTDKARKELYDMGFMKKAKEREEKELESEMAKLQSDIARYKRGEALQYVNDLGEDVAESKADMQKKAAAAAGAAAGRMKFNAPNATIVTKQSAEDEALDGALFAETPINNNNANDDEINEEHDDEEKSAAANNTDADELMNKKTSKKNKKLKVQAAPLKAGGIAADGSVSVVSAEDEDYISSSVVSKAHDGSDFVGLRKGKKGAAAESKRGRADADEFDSRDDAAVVEDASAATTDATTKKKAHATTRITIHPSENEIIPVATVGSLLKGGAAASSSSSVSGGLSSGDESTDGNNANAHQLQQEYLASRAFAKDDIDEDFLKMKEQQVEAIMKPADKNATLPGWGEWGGDDERLNIRHKKKVEQMTLERNLKKTALMKARADAKLDHVIISHEVDLMPSKYALHMIPRPFSNAKEYIVSMRQPVGPEWNSPMTFKETTQPRITTVQGAIIEPQDISVRKEKAKTKRRKVEKKKTL